MSVSWPFKDPDEVLDYDVDWSLRLDTDTIASFTPSVASGDVTIDSSDFTNTVTKVWLSGGTTDCEVLNRIVTAGGRTMDQTVKLKIKDR